MNTSFGVSLAMIVRDCADELRRCLQSIHEHVDEMVIVNTGKDESEAGFKETSSVAEEFGARVIHFPWSGRFDDARNVSFDACTNPVAIWLDSDDEVVNAAGLRKAIEESFTTGERCDALVVPYYYSFYEDGTPALVQRRDRVVIRYAYEWRGAVHETLCAKLSWSRKAVDEELCYIRHHKKAGDESEKTSLLRNQKIFAEQYGSIENDKITVRDLLYWGNTLYGMRRYDDALTLYMRYMDKTDNKPEAFLAMQNICSSYRLMTLPDEAMQWANRMVSAFPEYPIPYLEVAECHYMNREHRLAISFAKRCLELKDNAKFQPTMDPGRVNDRPRLIILHCAADSGDWAEVEKQLPQVAGTGIDKNVFDSVVKTLNDYRRSRSVYSAVRVLVEGQDEEHCRKVAAAVPPDRADLPGIRGLVPLSPSEKGNRVAFLCYQTAMNWDHKSVERGISGSEEAVVFLSRELACLGWEVYVYAPVPGHSVDQYGVTWEHIGSWNPSSHFDVFVSWRSPEKLRGAGVNARASFLWLHDIPIGHQWHFDTHQCYNGIFVLSEYHKRMFDWVPEDKLIVSANGLDLETCHPSPLEEERKPHRMIWPSDPSRGLQHLLPWWERIRSEVPDAEIHVFYGWSPTFMKHMKENPRLRGIHDLVEDLRRQDGVHWHGMIAQSDLNDFSAKCSIWPYMTDFPEIYCINAIKMQAHGVWPVVPTFGALNETVRFGDRVPCDSPVPKSSGNWEVSPDPSKPEWQAAYIDVLINRLKAIQDTPREELEKMVEWARGNTWNRVAKQWDQAFKEALSCSKDYRRWIPGDQAPLPLTEQSPQASQSEASPQEETETVSR